MRDLCAENFHEVLQKFHVLKKHTEKEVINLVGAISSQMGNKAVREARLATRLMIVALIFLPLSFVAGLFNMNGRFALDREGGWIYWCVAIPLTMAVTFAGLYQREQI